MTEPANLDSYRDCLLNRQRELLGIADISANSSSVVTLDQSRVGRLSRMDAMQAQALSIAADGRRSIELDRIKQALRRIDGGEYGYCERCGEPITVARLRIDPAAEYCVGCAEAIERSN